MYILAKSMCTFQRILYDMWVQMVFWVQFPSYFLYVSMRLLPRVLFPNHFLLYPTLLTHSLSSKSFNHVTAHRKKVEEIEHSSRIWQKMPIKSHKRWTYDVLFAGSQLSRDKSKPTNQKNNNLNIFILTVCDVCFYASSLVSLFRQIKGKVLSYL